MALTPGTRLGVYDITAQIGEGGMGQVWRATDTSLGRQVAIKILPEAFAADPERLARFEREAKTLAALNHPHIAAIYAVEKSGGTLALVMELVEGEDLSQRIARGAIPIDEALPIAKQIAEALEAAHEQSIIHRDLKPANIKVRGDGTVKVLDFGLAKALEGSPAGADPANSPTITSPAMTRASVILGTAAYMSPEQARGATVDRRADIWAFGVVLYELLTGRACFAGQSITDVLAAVVRAEPEWSALPAETPSRVRDLLRRCLTKDRKQRLHDIGDARLEIEEAMSGAGATAPAAIAAALSLPAGLRAWRAVPWVLATASLLALAGVGVALWTGRWSTSPASPTPATIRFTVANVDQAYSTGSGGTGYYRQFALSPDGRTLFYSAAGKVWSIAASGNGKPEAIRDGDAVAADPRGDALIIQLNAPDNVQFVRRSLPGGSEQPLSFPGVRPAGTQMSANAIGPNGILLKNANYTDSWPWNLALLSPGKGQRVILPALDVQAAGWTASGKIVVFAARTSSTIWRLRPVAREN